MISLLFGLSMAASTPASAYTIIPENYFTVRENEVSPQAPLHVGFLFYPADLLFHSRVTLSVYDSSGEFVATFYDSDIRRLTRYEATWECVNASGARVVPGVYVIQAVTPIFVRRYRVAVRS